MRGATGRKSNLPMVSRSESGFRAPNPCRFQEVRLEQATHGAGQRSIARAH